MYLLNAQFVLFKLNWVASFISLFPYSSFLLHPLPHHSISTQLYKENGDKEYEGGWINCCYHGEGTLYRKREVE